jgi:hypothetical protein
MKLSILVGDCEVANRSHIIRKNFSLSPDKTLNHRIRIETISQTLSEQRKKLLVTLNGIKDERIPHGNRDHEPAPNMLFACIVINPRDKDIRKLDQRL